MVVALPEPEMGSLCTSRSPALGNGNKRRKKDTPMASLYQITYNTSAEEVLRRRDREELELMAREIVVTVG